MTQTFGRSVQAVVNEHVDAFNAHDRGRLIAGLAPDVVWTTGADTFHGAEALAAVFDDGLWAMHPSLTVTDLVATGNRAAAQVLEALTVDGERRRYRIAVFFRVVSDVIAQVTVYREGSADIG